MILNIIFLILGIIILVKGADIFIDSGTEIGKVFKISEIILGLTFVAFGTSLPELCISVMGASKGSSGLVIGNIVGTNLFNICVILGMVCLISPLKLLRQTVRKDIYMSFLTSVILLVVLLDTFLTNLTENIISRTDGIILLLFFGVFMYYTLYEFGEYNKQREAKLDKKEEKIIINKATKKKILKNLVIAIIGIAMVFLGSDLIVNNAVEIARGFKISETFIGIAIIGIGTSMPEVFTTIAAVKKNRINIAIGNLIGSNMFNTLLILGVSSIVSPIALPSSLLLIDCAVFISVCAVMILFTKRKFEISRLEGLVLIMIYVIYMIFTVVRG